MVCCAYPSGSMHMHALQEVLSGLSGLLEEKEEEEKKGGGR